MKNNKGITLIALIITIIVMLILVATTVLMVINSDLIGTAKGAKTSTEQAYEDEKSYGMNVTIKNKNYTSVGDYGKPNGGNGGEDDTTGGNDGADDTTGGNDGADDGAIQVAENPTHALYVQGTKYLIDNATTWEHMQEIGNLSVWGGDYMQFGSEGNYFFSFDSIAGVRGVDYETPDVYGELSDRVIDTVGVIAGELEPTSWYFYVSYLAGWYEVSFENYPSWIVVEDGAVDLDATFAKNEWKPYALYVEVL